MARRTRSEPTPQQVVEAGYDVIAERYLAWSALRPSPARLRALAIADAAIPTGADVLQTDATTCTDGQQTTARVKTDVTVVLRSP